MKLFNILILIFLFTIPNLLGNIKNGDSKNYNNVDESAKFYISDLSDKLLHILKREINNNDKINLISQLLEKNLDFELMAKGALGRYNRIIGNNFNKYLTLYKDYTINNETKIINHYDGQEIKVLRVKSLGGQDYVAKSKLYLNNFDSVNIDFYLYCSIKSNIVNCKIYDILKENISLISTQRSEFSSIIGKYGIEGLLKRLDESYA